MTSHSLFFVLNKFFYITYRQENVSLLELGKTHFCFQADYCPIRQKLFNNKMNVCNLLRTIPHIINVQKEEQQSCYTFRFEKHDYHRTTIKRTYAMPTAYHLSQVFRKNVFLNGCSSVQTRSEMRAAKNKECIEWKQLENLGLS